MVWLFSELKLNRTNQENIIAQLHWLVKEPGRFSYCPMILYGRYGLFQKPDLTTQNCLTTPVTVLIKGGYGSIFVGKFFWLFIRI